MKKSDRERRTDGSTCKMMPTEFEPAPYEVLIGRGRRCTTHWGNQRFRSMVRAELDAYCAAADCKSIKSAIIGRVLGDIKKHSPHAGFVKKDVGTGRWLSLTDGASRVKIAQAFRDALEDGYRSSRHSKQVKRRVGKKAFPVGPMKTCIKQEEEGVKETDHFNFDPLPIHQDTPCNDATISSVEFTALFEAFTQDVDMEADPFEPFPIAVAHGEKEILTSNNSFGSNPPFRVMRVAKSA